MNAEYITLEQATAYFPLRYGKPITTATLRYRIRNGCRGVRLEALLSGGTWYTTKAAIDRFHDQLKEKSLTNAPPLRRTTSKAARDYLKGLGIGGKENRKDRRASQSKAKAKSQ